MAAAMTGIDVLLFTGGVGEHAPAVACGAAEGLASWESSSTANVTSSPAATSSSAGQAPRFAAS